MEIIKYYQWLVHLLGASYLAMQNENSFILQQFYNKIINLTNYYKFNGFILDLEGSTNTNKTLQTNLVIFLNNLSNILHENMILELIVEV